MSKEFIERKINSSSIAEARRQQEQLGVFTQSNIQQDITQAYINQWAGRNYEGPDYFLNWVKTIFKTDNFLSFYKYFRHPVASSRLVNNLVKPQLKRVFFSEDAFFHYTINGEEVETPEELDVDNFNELMFNAQLFRHNDILVTDLSDVNTPFRKLISIKNVVSIISHNSVIRKIAFTAEVPIINEVGEVEIKQGFLYLDDVSYKFYDSNLLLLLDMPHDLGECPADYITKEPFADDDVVRKSVFSYAREELEEYVFLKTLQRMSEPNGAIPVITQLKAQQKTPTNQDIKGVSAKEPMASNLIGGQVAEFGKQVNGSNSLLQHGTIIEITPKLKNDGSIDMDMVKNFINFFFIPVESLDYLEKRILSIKNSIIVTLLGAFSEQSEAAKNELQVKGSFVNREDILRDRSADLSRIRQRSDFKMLALAHGRDRVTNEAFYGSDFFLETQNQIYELFNKSPNTIERKNLLIRLTKNKNRFNPDKKDRQVILYSLLPYISDRDFETAREQSLVDVVTFQYQVRFNYWVNVFEAQFGDILVFWEIMEGTTAEKLALINGLILGIIEEDIKDKEMIVSPIAAILPQPNDRP